MTLALKHNDARLVNDIATMLGCDTGRRHIQRRLVTSGGPATLREATTDVTFAEILDFLPVLPCPPPPLPVVRDGPEQTRVAPLVAAGATLYTLIAF